MGFNDSDESLLVTNETDTRTYPALLKQSLPMIVVYTVAYTAVFLLGVVGNSLVVWIIIKNVHMHTVTNYFIVNLAVADILVCVFCLPITLLSNLFSGWIYGEFMCKATPFLQGVSVNASVNTLMAVAFDRYLAICHGMRCHLTRRMARAIIAVIWTFAGTVISPWAVFYQRLASYDYWSDNEHAPSFDTTPTAVSFRTDRPGSGDTTTWVSSPPTMTMTTMAALTDVAHEPFEYICKQVWTTPKEERIYFVGAIFFACYMLPLICISACYVFICRRVCNRHAFGVHDNGGSGPSVIQRSKVKVIKMLVTVVVVFAFSWLPLYIVQLRLYFGPDLDPYSAEFSWLVEVIIPVSQWAGSANSCVNPFIYCFFSKKFRAGFRQLLASNGCCCCCCRPTGGVAAGSRQQLTAWQMSRASFAATGGSAIYRNNSCVVVVGGGGPPASGAVRQMAFGRQTSSTSSALGAKSDEMQFEATAL